MFSLPVPSQICRAEYETLDCNDDNSCTVDTCDEGASQCLNTLISNCCGNSICETGERPSCTADCGPFSISTPNPVIQYTGLYATMFDVEAINDIDISSISLNPIGSGTITVFSAARTYSGIETDSQSWTQIYTGSATSGLFKAEFSSINILSGSTQA